MTLTLLVALVIAAVVIEGFFSGSEMALISADRLALHKMAQKGNKGAKLALKLVAKPERVLATTLVGTNACVALTATLSTLYVFKNYGTHYEVETVLALSPIVLIFGEIIPKTIFQRYSEALAPRVAPLVQLASWFFRPMIWVLEVYTDWLSRRLQPIEEAVTGRRPSHREELRYLLTYGQKEISLKTSERRMIRRILDFSKAEAKNAMLPLIKVDMIEDSLLVDEALEAFTRFGHSRLPVYHERVDNVVGVLHAFDLFSEQDGAKPVTQVMKPAHYAPESQQLEKLLYTMQRRGIQMAIIVDEYGGAVGILALEDILEEIVGDIKDEYDHDTSLYRELSEREYLIQGQMEIAAINELLKLNLPRGDYETLAGFLLQQFDRIPEEGDELYYGDLKFVVRKASSRMIQTVQMTLAR
ncbi:MAG: HlyC/CorC family transporter [Deltaproteobacteria bacterium]|nr:HlyC/CorC family transporter [Deltaproteobacteria bacterium]